MKALLHTARDKNYIKKCAKYAAEQQLENVSKRSQALWAAAAINAGYTADDVLKIMGELAYVTEKYAERLEDGVGDYALWQDLERAGIELAKPVEIR